MRLGGRNETFFEPVVKGWGGSNGKINEYSPKTRPTYRTFLARSVSWRDLGASLISNVPTDGLPRGHHGSDPYQIVPAF